MLLHVKANGQVTSSDLDPEFLASLFGGEMTATELKEKAEEMRETIEWIERVHVYGPPRQLTMDEAKKMTFSEFFALCEMGIWEAA